MIEKNKLYLIALSQVEGIGDKRIGHLISHYKSIENIFLSNDREILNALNTGFRGATVKNFSKDIALEKAQKIIDDSDRRNIKIISFFEDVYPFSLKQIDDPPYILYTKGDLKHLRRNSVAIVGTRDARESSMKYAFDISSSISSLNISVVSGLAKGIDTAAHRGAISTLGNTVAVLGNGIDIVYPSENIRLYDKIIEKGLIISEFATGVGPERRNFPRRNRIISGMSFITIMVEAKNKSGALITVDYALEQGRDVYIAPYDEKDNNFFGNHKLYKDGAKIVYDANDILEDFDAIFSLDSEYVKMKNKYFEGGLIKESINNSGTQIRKPIKKTEKYNASNVIGKYNANNVIEKHTASNITENEKQKPKTEEKNINTLNLAQDEKVIYEIILNNKKIHLDDIVEKSNMNIQTASSVLMQLELKSIISQMEGKVYKLEG